MSSSPLVSSSDPSSTSTTIVVNTSDDDSSDDQEDAHLLKRTRPTMADFEYAKTLEKSSPSSSNSSADIVDPTTKPNQHLITHDNTNASIMVCELFTAQCACFWFGIIILFFGIYAILQYQCIIPFRPYAAYAIIELVILPLTLLLVIAAYSHFQKLRYAISTSNLYALPLLLWLFLFTLVPIFGWALFTGILTPNRKNMTVVTSTTTLAPISLLESETDMFMPDPRNAPCRNLDTNITVSMAYITNAIHSFCLLLFLIGCCHPAFNRAESTYLAYNYHGDDTIESKRKAQQAARNTPKKPPTEPSWFARYKTTPSGPDSIPPPVAKSIARTTSLGDFIGTHPRQSSQLDPTQVAKILAQNKEDEKKISARAAKKEKKKRDKQARRESTTSHDSRRESTISNTSDQSRRDSIASQTSLDNIVATLREPNDKEQNDSVVSVAITVNDGAHSELSSPSTPNITPNNTPPLIEANTSPPLESTNDIPRSVSSHGLLVPPEFERSSSTTSTVSASSSASYTVPFSVTVIPPTPDQEAQTTSRPVSPLPDV